MGKNNMPPSRIDLEAQQSAQLYNWDGTVTITPSIKCPVELKDISEEAVHLWVNRVIAIGHEEKNCHYAPSALRYFAASFFERSTPEFQQIANSIATAFDLELTIIATAPPAHTNSATAATVPIPKIPKKSAGELANSLGKVAVHLSQSQEQDIEIND